MGRGWGGVDVTSVDEEFFSSSHAASSAAGVESDVCSFISKQPENSITSTSKQAQGRRTHLHQRFESNKSDPGSRGGGKFLQDGRSGASGEREKGGNRSLREASTRNMIF